VLAVVKVMGAKKVEVEEVAEEECPNKENEAPKAVSFDFSRAQAARKAVSEGLQVEKYSKIVFS
jgi:hypothetical protein